MQNQYMNTPKAFSYFKMLLQRVAIAFLVSTLCRLVFYIFNIENFVGNPINAFFQGLRFDAVSVTYCFAPMILLSLLPLPWRRTRIYQGIIEFTFYLGIVLTIIPNFVDTISYHFTVKRSTADVLQFATTGDDASKVIPDFIRENWFLVIVLIVVLWGVNKLYNFTKKHFVKVKTTIKSFIIQFGVMLLGLGLLVLGARGGMELKPINIIEASRYVKPNFVPVVLNTPFTILKTLLQESIKPKTYFTQDKVDSLYKPHFIVKSDHHISEEKKNVVVLILESFAKEYVGYFNPDRHFTPFLDSLMQESLVFTDAYASGQQSIDAVPAIFSSLPDLMSRPYILSSYSNNKLPGLPTALNNQGYQTSFFHGGNNGTMGFDGFMNNVGIQNYFGLDQYPEEDAIRDTDGKWGIYDGPYLEYFANELGQQKQPFFSSIFTLSSHFPYTLPKGYENKYPKGEHEIMELVAYSDDMLKAFFKKIENEEWFKNTMFVITADHTAQPIDDFYKSRIGKYAIPLFIYSPKGDLKGVDTLVSSHVDIMPTILDYAQLDGTYFAHGASLLDKERAGYAMQFENGLYQYVDNDYLIVFDGENMKECYRRPKVDQLEGLRFEIITDEERKKIKAIVKKIKAIIQKYNETLIYNKLYIP